MQNMRNALNDFNEDPETRVFLLCLGTAAAGLTLTRANHVFLLEPGLDPAVEQQAVARVHRYGQTRPVKIVRLLLQVSPRDPSSALSNFLIESNVQFCSFACDRLQCLCSNAVQIYPNKRVGDHLPSALIALHSQQLLAVRCRTRWSRWC